MSGDDGAGEARVDRALASLARDVPPDRDLWPAIAAGLEPRRAVRRWLPLAAAAVLLVAASSLITSTLVRRAEGPVAARPEAVPAAPGAQRAAFGPGHALDAEYAAARQQLAAMLALRIDRLPNSARQKLEDNLAVLHRAADEINAALALQPGDPLLEELLLNTYQDELAVLASVNQLTNLNGAMVPGDTRIKL
ncbi:MAG TPA: hypothetical protein VGA44_10730 [Steroidobacteraceae bacterium]